MMPVNAEWNWRCTANINWPGFPSVECQHSVVCRLIDPCGYITRWPMGPCASWLGANACWYLREVTLWHHSGHMWTCHDVCNKPWVVPPPSSSGKWRFIGIPYYKCYNPGGDCYWAGGQPKINPSNLEGRFLVALPEWFRRGKPLLLQGRKTCTQMGHRCRIGNMPKTESILCNFPSRRYNYFFLWFFLCSDNWLSKPKMLQHHRLQVIQRPSKSLLDSMVMSCMRPSLFQPR